MGSGGSVTLKLCDSPNAEQCHYDKIESLARKRYFWHCPVEFKSAVEQSIKLSILDVLELLLKSGDMQLVNPLHIAAGYGNLECLELLISAGFSIRTKNNNGQVPLHLCSLNPSSDSALCAILLAILPNGGLNCWDVNGKSPLHLAAEANNLKVFRALIQNGANIVQLDKAGRRCMDLAIARNHKEIVAEIESMDALTRSSQTLHMKNKKKCVDPERIMQVWECFFANALKNMEEETCNDHDSPSVLEPSDMICGLKTDVAPKFDSSRLVDWFDRIACCTVDGSWYVLHSRLGTTKWLDEHIKSQQRHQVCPKHWSDIEVMRRKSLPSTCLEAAYDGWMPHYHSTSNTSIWISIPTMLTEDWLPIGLDEFVDQLTLPLPASCEGDCTWRQCYQVASTSWMIVVPHENEDQYSSQPKQSTRKKKQTAKDKLWDDEVKDDKGSGLYYCNRMTGDTSWSEPAGWRDWVTCCNGGWYLCSGQVDDWALYWWHEESGQTIWAEEY